MAIRYDIILDNNFIYPIQYICFGSLNSLYDCEIPEGFYNNSDIISRNVTNSELRNNFRVDKIKYIRFNYDWYNHDGMTDENMEKFKSELKLILTAFPFIKDSMFMLDEYIYVTVKDTPADKVMFTLSLVRNLAMCYLENDTPQGPYIQLRNAGIPAFEAMVFGDLVYTNISHNWNSGRALPYIYVNCKANYNTESSLFNFSRFGMQSYQQLKNADEHFNPWVQDTFAENGHGYYRTSHFASNGIMFNEEVVRSPEYSALLVDSYGGTRAIRIERMREVLFGSSRSDGRYMTSLYRSLPDWASVLNDSEPLFPGVKHHPLVGFYQAHKDEADILARHPVTGEDLPNDGARFDALVEYINTLL